MGVGGRREKYVKGWGNKHERNGYERLKLV